MPSSVVKTTEVVKGGHGVFLVDSLDFLVRLTDSLAESLHLYPVPFQFDSLLSGNLCQMVDHEGDSVNLIVQLFHLEGFV